MQIHAFLEGVSRLLSLRNGHLKRFSFIQVIFNPKPKWVQNFYRNKKAYSSEFQKGGAGEGIRTPIY